MYRLLLLCTSPDRRRLWQTLLLALLFTITWLALSPAPPPAASVGWDKANHLLAFAALGFAGVWALWPQPRHWGWLVLALLSYGLGIEIAQGFLPPRQADWHDVAADGLGIALGLLTAWSVQLASRRVMRAP